MIENPQKFIKETSKLGAMINPATPIRALFPGAWIAIISISVSPAGQKASKRWLSISASCP
jgi:hypothetical protein